jgi:hypothetical protein
MIIDKSREYYDNEYKEGDFGWNFFTAASDEAKKLYAATALKCSFSGLVGYEAAAMLVRGLGLDFSNETLDHSYIDHQSQPSFPLTFNEEFKDLDYCRDFINYITQKGLVILGGNDNTSEVHALYDEELESVVIPRTCNQVVCRKDGDHWTLFDRSNGDRLTMSFKNEPKKLKLSAPFLIDLKITDFCDRGCSFCYQNSTMNGKHGNTQNILSLIYKIGLAEVFEVAIGGGEPTAHPDFLYIIHELRRNNIVPNFSTKDIAWLCDDVKRKVVLENCGGFAVSVSSKEEVASLNKVLTKYDILRNYPIKVSVQVIPGLLSENVLEEILKEAGKGHLQATLLGHKPVGRASGTKALTNEKSWVKIVKKLSKIHECPSLSIDTTLAKLCEAELKKIKLPNWMYHIEEGKYSMYIDAVNNKFGPSSYHVDKLKDIGNMVSVETMFSKIKAI